MEINTVLGIVVHKKLLAYQEISNSKRNMPCRFTKNESGRVGFQVDWEDKSRPLVIDPLIYSTFIGGSNQEGSDGLDFDTNISADGIGNVVISGYTRSIDFPTTVGAYDVTWNGEGGLPSGAHGDIFVSKLNADGSNLIFSTFIGGSLCEGATAAILGNQEEIFITGWTLSRNFPTTSSAFDTSYNGQVGDSEGIDVIVVKLSNDGSNLIYSTYLGGKCRDQGISMAVDNTGNAIITGVTASDNFPITPGAYDQSYNGGGSVGGGQYGDVFVSKLNSNGTALIYSTYIGGANIDCGNSIILDANGNAIITGHTYSSDFPTTSGAYNETYNGGAVDAFLCKLNTDGTGLIFSTFMGGSNSDWSHDVVLDMSGNIVIAGRTESNNFPTTQNVYDTTYCSGEDVFVSKFNSSGSGLLCSTLIGGSGNDQCLSLAVDKSNNFIITGFTSSTDYPYSSGCYDNTYNGGANNVFISKLDGDLSNLLYSSYLGGNDSESGHGLVLDANGDAIITGVTGSINFPTTKGAYDQTYNGGVTWGDVFVSKFDLNISTSNVSLADYSNGKFNYRLTYGSGTITRWSLTCQGGITNAEIAAGSSAEAAGWDGVSYTTTMVIFAHSTGWDGSGSPIDGFNVYGTEGGTGIWTCHSSNGTVDASLSVEMGSISAVLKNSCIIITWFTESETNSSHFNIYRAMDENEIPIKINTAPIQSRRNTSTRTQYEYIDRNIIFGFTYWYFIESVDTEGRCEKYGPIQVIAEQKDIPKKFTLYQNYPNPFNPATIIEYDIPEDTELKLLIYDLNGKIVKRLVDAFTEAGHYKVFWDGSDDNAKKSPKWNIHCKVYLSRVYRRV